MFNFGLHSLDNPPTTESETLANFTIELRYALSKCVHSNLFSCTLQHCPPPFLNARIALMMCSACRALYPPPPHASLTLLTGVPLHTRTVLTGVCQRARDREIAAIVKNHSDRAIWVTTTPVPLNVTSGPSRHNRDVIRFNAAAARVMSELSIPICDVYSAVMRCARRPCKLHEHCSLEHTHLVPPFPHSFSTTVAATSSLPVSLRTPTITASAPGAATPTPYPTALSIYLAPSQLTNVLNPNVLFQQGTAPTRLGHQTLRTRAALSRHRVVSTSQATTTCSPTLSTLVLRAALHHRHRHRSRLPKRAPSPKPRSALELAKVRAAHRRCWQRRGGWW